MAGRGQQLNSRSAGPPHRLRRKVAPLTPFLLEAGVGAGQALIDLVQGLLGLGEVPFVAALIVIGLGLVIGAGMIHQHFRSASRRSTEPTSAG